MKEFAAGERIDLTTGRVSKAATARITFRARVHSLPLAVHVLLLIASLVLFLIVAAPAAGQVIPDCTAAGQGQCDPLGNCRYHPSPGALCVQTHPGCANCYIGLRDPLKAGDLRTPAAKYDPAEQWRGYFDGDGKYVVTHPGFLADIGVLPGDVLETINGWRVTPRRLHNWLYRRHRAMRVRYSRAGVSRAGVTS